MRISFGFNMILFAAKVLPRKHPFLPSHSTEIDSYAGDEKLANRNISLRFGTGRQKMVLERGTTPTLFCVVRVALGRATIIAEENRRASRETAA
jgi:hypothetical protein